MLRGSEGGKWPIRHSAALRQTQYGVAQGRTNHIAAGPPRLQHEARLSNGQWVREGRAGNVNHGVCPTQYHHQMRHLQPVFQDPSILQVGRGDGLEVRATQAHDIEEAGRGHRYERDKGAALLLEASRRMPLFHACWRLSMIHRSG